MEHYGHGDIMVMGQLGMNRQKQNNGRSSPKQIGTGT